MRNINNWTHYESRESIIHERAKQIILGSSYIRLPEVTLQLGNSPKYFIDQEKYIFIQTKEQEKPMGNIRPDLVVVSENGERVIIEINVSHPVDEEKLKKIEQLNIDTIEIDLSDLTTNQNRLPQILEEILIQGVDRKYWLFNKREKWYKQNLTERCTMLTTQGAYGGHTLAWECPLELRISSIGSVYAYLKECKKCIHYFGMGPNNSILCGCKNPIETLGELLIPPHEFKDIANKRIQVYKQISNRGADKLGNNQETVKEKENNTKITTLNSLHESVEDINTIDLEKTVGEENDMDTSIINSLSESIEVINTLGFGGTIKEEIEYVGTKKRKKIKTIDSSKIVGYRILNIGIKPIEYRTEIWNKNTDGNYSATEIERVLNPKEAIDLTKYYMALLSSRPEILLQLSNGKMVKGTRIKNEDTRKQLESYYFKFDRVGYGKVQDVNNVNIKINIARKIEGNWEIKEQFNQTFGFMHNKSKS